MTTNYRRGADFERRVGRDFEEHGYCVVRSAGSHSPTDLVAMRGLACPVCVQCKTNGRLDPDEWNEFWEWCQTAGAVPIVAHKGKRGQGVQYKLLEGRKDGTGRQPWVPWEPERWE